MSFPYLLLIDFGISGLSAGIKWRPDPSELPQFGPEFKRVWDAYFANAPDKPVLWMGIMAACVFHADSPYYFMPLFSTMYPG
jgi:alcohol oxidase